MAFRYKFGQLLRLAIHEEDEVKTRLAIKDGQIAEIDSILLKLKESFERGLEDKTEDLLAGRMQKIRMYVYYFARLENEKEFNLEERGRLVAQREKILVELAEKRRVRKTYEKLRERHEKSYQKSEAKKDQKLMDDFASRSATLKGA